MRIGTLALLVAVFAIGLALAREPIGRTFVLVFLTGVGEVALGLAAVMSLFQAIGAFGEARTIPEHADALLMTVGVLAVSSWIMTLWLCAGIWLVLTLV